MSRVRRSTWLALAIFVCALLLYVGVPYLFPSKSQGGTGTPVSTTTTATTTTTQLLP